MKNLYIVAIHRVRVDESRNGEYTKQGHNRVEKPAPMSRFVAEWKENLLNRQTMKTIIFILFSCLACQAQTIVDTCTIEVPPFDSYQKGLSVRFSNGETVLVSNRTPHKYMEWYYFAGSRFKMWEVKKINRGYPRGFEIRVRPLDIPRGKYTQHKKPLTLGQKWEKFLDGKK